MVVDLVVVGAGWHGLVAAKTYIQLHPDEDVVVLEAESTCGGTWSEDRLYPGLKSNNLLDTYEYPDFPMSTDVYGVKPGEHIPGPVLHRYLTDFAKEFGVFSKIRFNTNVESIRPSKYAGWVLAINTNGEHQLIETKKIILATGLTSQANMPSYPGAQNFNKPLFHAKDFCRNGDTVKTAQDVVIIGGGKSAMDLANAYASAGAHVDMVIRPSGKGPVWISYPWVLGGKKRLEKLLSVRFLTWFSPCIFGGVDGSGWIRRLLHATFIGRFLVEKFWSSLGGEVLEVNGYAKHAELKKLQPWDPAYWIGSGLSIHNYDKEYDLFEMVRKGQINVHIADVKQLSSGTVHLDDGSELTADVLACATGWKKESSIRFVDFDIGLPQSPSEQTELANAADEKVLKTLPRLRDQPKLNFTPASNPYRLYRFIVPPAYVDKRNIAFAGMVSSVSTATAANAQALWISTFFDGKLDCMASTKEEVAEEVMLHTQWCKWRHPTGYGANLPDMAFDALPYIGLLLRDLGLDVWRKSNLWAEFFHPYGPPDFAGLVETWSLCH